MKTFYHHIRRENFKGNWVDHLYSQIEKAFKNNQINMIRNRGDKPSRTIQPQKITACTICVIEDDSRNEIARGYAFCSSADQFSRKRGRQIAEGRAMKMARQKGVDVGALVN